MRIRDARKGVEIQPGDEVIYPLFNGRPDPDDYQLISVEEHLFSAVATLRLLGDGTVHRVPLAVRFTHPRFFLTKVAFVPS